MDIIVVGGGGREHTIIKKLRENSSIQTIYALPGNGGIAQDATCVNIAATDLDGVVKFAQEKNIGFAVVAPDDPLVMGLADRLRDIGIPCFGPSAKAAAIEGSKVFSKNLMRKYGIPTAEYNVFSDSGEALEYLKTCAYPIVIKADGLALGKGVLICEDHKAAQEAIASIMEEKIFGESGSNVVIEEFLTGPEVSVLAFTDGNVVKPMVSSMDHKRALDGDQGLNTGGMGTIAPNPYYTEEIAERCMKEIFLPTINAMNAEDRTFKGCLYFGLMLTPNGPKVIEYNCRFGDPEAQVVLPLLKTDLFTVMQAVENGTLADLDVEFADACACCVMVVSGGYPAKYVKGNPITIEPMERARYFHSGTKLTEDGTLVNNGGRVIGAVGMDKTLKGAIANAYQFARAISFEGAYMRSDIGERALKAGEE